LTYKEKDYPWKQGSIEEITPYYTSCTFCRTIISIRKSKEMLKAEEVGAHVQPAHVPQDEYLRSGFSLAFLDDMA
jgi:hypothetical protein